MERIASTGKIVMISYASSAEAGVCVAGSVAGKVECGRNVVVASGVWITRDPQPVSSIEITMSNQDLAIY